MNTGFQSVRSSAVRTAATGLAALLPPEDRPLPEPDAPPRENDPGELLDAPEIAGDPKPMAVAAQPALPPIVDAADFLAEQVTPPSELVYGVLHQGSKLALGGGSKTFKTWTLLDLAVSVGAGEPWLSHKTAKGRVLFLNFEIQPAFLQQRLRAVAKAKNVVPTKGQIDIWNLRGCATGYGSILPRISERVKEACYRLIILDPIYKLYGSIDENSAGAVAQLLNSLESLAVESGAAVAFGAHYSKGNQSGKEAVDRISGSGVFARDPDTILNFTRHQEQDAFTVETTLRNFRPLDSFVVRWAFPLMRRDDSLDPAQLKKPIGRKPEHDPADLLKVLPDTGLRSKDWENTAAKLYRISGTTFNRLRKALEQQGKVEKSNALNKWIPVKKNISAP